MAHGVTYVELYLRRLDGLKRQHFQKSDHGAGRSAGQPGDRSASSRALWSASRHAPSTPAGTSAHALVTEHVTDLGKSGLISAHVPERQYAATDDGPCLVCHHDHGDSAIPSSPSAVKRCHKWEQQDWPSTKKSKIPRHPAPYDASAIRSHPLAFGVIKSCQLEASAVHDRNGQQGYKGKKKGGSGPQRHAPDTQSRRPTADSLISASENEERDLDRDLSGAHSLSMSGDFLRPPPRMYCALTSEDMLLQYMRPRSDRGAQ